MVRETRGSAAARDVGATPSPSTDTGAKRKRRTSDASAALASPTKGALDGENGDAKRQRVNGDKIDEEPEDESEGPGRVLTQDVREAIATVISQMAKQLPPPINNVLTLRLPPDFEATDENTLAYMLKQDSLTWEKLVSTLHLFSEKLLSTSSYPNPFPSLKRIHLPVPPLASHYPPLILYSFSSALRSLLLQVEPVGDGSAPLNAPQYERWALMQKTPGNGLGTSGGEWFTSSADLREVEHAVRKVKPEEGTTLLETLAGSGDKFGHAQPVIVQTTGVLGLNTKDAPCLSESVIRRASLKAQRWKDARKARRTGSWSNIVHPVSVPRIVRSADPKSTPTPSFGPFYDSTSASGLGYYSTLDLLHESARQREWSTRTAKITELAEDAGWTGEIGKDDEKKAAEGDEEPKALETPDDVLAANAERIEELQTWQNLRVRRGDAEWITERERAVADELFASLAKLVEDSATPPSALLPDGAKSSSAGLAHKLASRLLSTRAPLVRGTLDPRRNHALHDNATIRLRPQAAAAIGAPPSSLGLNGMLTGPHAPPPKAAYQTSPQTGLREPPPHIMPPGTRYYPGGRFPPGTPQAHPQHQQHPGQASPMHQQGSPMHQQAQMMSTPKQQVPMQGQMRMPPGYPQQMQHPQHPQHHMQPQQQQQQQHQGHSPQHAGQSPVPYRQQSGGPVYQTPPQNAYRPPMASPGVSPGGVSVNMGVASGRPSPMPLQQGYPPRMTGPGPSNLRQSFGPGPVPGMSPQQMQQGMPQMSPQQMQQVMPQMSPQQQAMYGSPGMQQRMMQQQQQPGQPMPGQQMPGQPMPGQQMPGGVPFMPTMQGMQMQMPMQQMPMGMPMGMGMQMPMGGMMPQMPMHR